MYFPTEAHFITLSGGVDNFSQKRLQILKIDLNPSIACFSLHPHPSVFSFVCLIIHSFIHLDSYICHSVPPTTHSFLCSPVPLNRLVHMFFHELSHPTIHTSHWFIKFIYLSVDHLVIN